MRDKSLVERRIIRPARPGQNSEMHETQCETQNVSLTAHYVKTAIRQSECK